MGLDVSVKKSCMLHLGPRNERLPYFLGVDELPARTVVKDLGIHVSEFDSVRHVTETIKRSAKLSNWIMRAFTLNEAGAYIKMYTSIVRPVML